MNQTDSLLMKAALDFATEKHTGQCRKDVQESPYISHPIGVAKVLEECGVTDIVTLQAALLHDIIEDTKTPVEELREKFGDEVTNIVLEVSDDKSLDKPVRKQLQIEHAPTISDRAKLVKIADKLMNIRDVTHNPPSHWDLERRVQYLDWSDAVVKGARGQNTKLEELYDRQAAEGRKMLTEAGAVS